MAIDKKRLLYRLKFYFIGFGLGIVVVWATLYHNRERPSWLPEGRILEFLAEADIALTEAQKCELECNNIPADFLATDTLFWKNAEVNFDKSAVRREPCPEHYIESKLSDGRAIGVYIENCETCENCEAELTANFRNFVFRGEEKNECECD